MIGREIRDRAVGRASNVACGVTPRGRVPFDAFLGRAYSLRTNRMNPLTEMLRGGVRLGPRPRCVGILPLAG